MHLVIYNCGTGDSGYNFAKTQAEYAQSLKDKNTQTLIVNGCHHEDVCDDTISPNLAKFANRFVSTVFTKNQNGQLILSKSSSDELAGLKVGIQPTDRQWMYDQKEGKECLVPQEQSLSKGEWMTMETVEEILARRKARLEGKATPDTPDKPPKGDENAFKNQNEAIESITFAGYSRGAVTCFNMAKSMAKTAPHVPIHIVADQPVPGNLYAMPGTNAASIADCSKLKNVKSVDLTVGAYTGLIDNEGIHSKFNSLLHRLVFSQMIPKLPTKDCKTNLSVIPRINHWTPKMSGDAHIHMYLTRQLADRGLLDSKTATTYEDKVNNFYKNFDKNINKNADKNKKLDFPEAKHLQSIFGANQADMYNYVDMRYIQNMDSEKHQAFLYQWWQAQETQSSIFSTQLTKELVQAIKDPIESNENEKLLDIFKKADEWLMIKDGSGSSRYNQVMKCRNRVQKRLLHIDPSNEAKMKESNINSLHQTHYFEKHWQRESKAASWFKTDATRELDKAFKAYGKAEKPSLKNDETLLKAIDQWINTKKVTNSSSRRFELVADMQEKLSTLIKQHPNYEPDPDSSPTPNM